jgi:cAMP-dependent protein kinase regulator
LSSDLASAEPLAESLGRLALFNDLPPEALEGLVSTVRELHVGEGAWVLHEGDENAGLHVILEGDAGIVAEGVELAVLHAGMFFGEISVLLDEPVAASVVARSPLRCAVIDRAELGPFLLDHPSVALRLLQAEARRVAELIRWRA